MFRKTKHITDPFYEDIDEDQNRLYQKYLDGLFAVIDVDNYTRIRKRRSMMETSSR